MARINYNGGYLYCNISDNLSDYTDFYSSSEECFNDIKSDILYDLIDYTDAEINVILEHYEIQLNNYDGEWYAHS